MKKTGRKAFLRKICIITLLIAVSLVVVDCVRFPECYIPTWKYQLENDIAKGDKEAIEYYNKVYVSKGKELFETPAPTTTPTATPQPTETPQATPQPTENPKTDLISLGTFKAYAYDACQSCCGKTPDHPAYGITASGTRATEGRTIAVDPSVIPLGSEVILKEGDNEHTYIAEDTGSGIVGKTIDIYHETHAAAKQHGVQYVEVFVRR